MTVSEYHDVVIVGGGPVGMFLGVLLSQRGLDVRVFEQRMIRSAHSRAIGIHPPALGALASAELADPLLGAGVEIHAGAARFQGRELARLSFAGVSKRFPFVLAVPQAHTNRILERRLAELNPLALQMSSNVSGLRARRSESLVELNVRQSGNVRAVRAGFVVGADGPRSCIRDELGLGGATHLYPDTYLMGDFADSTQDGSVAALYVEPHGIVESFPLPLGIRRWVARTTALVNAPEPDGLARIIEQRTGVEVDASTNSMLSAFEVRRSFSRRMWGPTVADGRVALIGDAAHEVSPIGGQGMNLGWLDAAALAPLIERCLSERGMDGRLLERFDRARRRDSARAARQAHINMVLGRPLAPPLLALRNLALVAAMESPLQRKVAKVFTMQ